MLNLNLASAPVLDNIIAINGVEIARLDDTNAQKILDIVRGMVNAPVASTPVTAPVKPTVLAPDKQLHLPDEKPTASTTVPGKPMWQEDFVTVTSVDVDGKKQYRLYINCPIGGEKGKKMRYALKASAKELGAKFAGDYDAKDLFWAFPNKAKADEYIKARKAYAKANQK
jgi:hypothetical protein